MLRCPKCDYPLQTMWAVFDYKGKEVTVTKRVHCKRCKHMAVAREVIELTHEEEE